MPYSRPGPGVYVTNGGTPIAHGSPVVNSNFVGVAVKQSPRQWQDSYAIQAQIDAGEPYFIITKGIVQVSNVGLTAANVGDAIYITAAGVLTATAAGNTKFGRLVEKTGIRGVPPNRCRIDLDYKDSF